MGWQPIETYSSDDPFFVLISDGRHVTVGCLQKYWHDLTEGDWRITSPMFNQPTKWKLFDQPPPEAK